MRIEAFAIQSNEGQATLAITGSNLTGVDTRRVKLADLAENLVNTRCWPTSAATVERITRYERAQVMLMA